MRLPESTEGSNILYYQQEQIDITPVRVKEKEHQARFSIDVKTKRNTESSFSPQKAQSRLRTGASLKNSDLSSKHNNSGIIVKNGPVKQASTQALKRFNQISVH